MDKIKKALDKLNHKEQARVKEILIKIDSGNFYGLDLKKIKGRKDIFRIRKGNIRIIFLSKNNSVKILTIERRASKTHKDF